jgi:hypothetical protein
LLAYKASKVLGKALGEALYASVIDGRLQCKEVALLFGQDLAGLNAAQALALYLQWARRLDRLEYRLGKADDYGES